ncbi:UNVERIFIED_CONTAM: putative serine/threonine-protein kinase [Sesamum calycinum]|uniref:Serine/threonine-protein kinase n=1 Tax=Sesamum calycinum TaxID=2727403 RepID=A0AAW2PN72_9LAMI
MSGELCAGKGIGGAHNSMWPVWLTAVAGEAIKGLTPRKLESFERLEKIGQGTYSNVYRARDLETGKIVALKKVRFCNMDPESLVTSRVSSSLYLVFEYMEHDLAGLTSSPLVKFTESQIKCYMHQLLRGLEHCHTRGIMHRDIKGSNILIDNNGNLKIGDFGLATFFDSNQNHPLTSRVVTLWYRAPELLLGATYYGVAVDLWSAGCILAELFTGKPIMSGRTEKVKMQPNPNKNSEKYNPEEGGGSGVPIKRFRRMGESRHSLDVIDERPNVDPHTPFGTSENNELKTPRLYKPQEVASGSSKPSCSVTAHSGSQLEKTETSAALHEQEQCSNTRNKQLNNGECRQMYPENRTVCAPKQTPINYSGPLLGGSVEKMLEDHQKQIQIAVRKAQMNKNRTRKWCSDNNPAPDYISR